MTRESRKLDHVRLAQESPRLADSDFDELHLVHRSFPETNVKDVELTTSVCGIRLHSPIFINAMTGGAVKTLEINRNLAVAAHETSLAMAVGSQRAALTNPELVETYRVVRKVNPRGIVISNLGAGATLEDAERAVDMLQANLLQIHVNVPQELVMEEGDRTFTGLLESIAKIVERVSVPLIVKEVGFGMSRETFEQLLQCGVKAVDVGGRGGTNFIWIEDHRRQQPIYDHLQFWGQSTTISLLEALPFQSELEVIGSGGIRNPLDVVKCFALGAKAVGMAGLFLREVESFGATGVIDLIHTWHTQLTTMMTMLGVTHVRDLAHVPLVVTGKTKEWAELRGINLRALANR